MNRRSGTRRTRSPVVVAAVIMLGACSGTETASPASSSQATSTETVGPATGTDVALAATTPPPPARGPTTSPDMSVPNTASAAGACPTFHSETRATLPDELTELSGWALSKRHDNVLWGHNDAGEGARLIGVSALDGSLVSHVTIDGATSHDWEDIATYTDPDGTHWIVIADTGDNAQRRDNVQLILVREPELGDATVDADAVVTVRWVTGAHDVEALIVDPLTGDAIMIGKRFSGEAQVSVDRIAAGLLQPGATIESEHIATFDVPSGQTFGPTAGSINAAGTTIGLLFYDNLALTWSRSPGTSVTDTILNDEPCAVASGTGKLESLAFTADGTMLIATEGRSVPLTALIPQ